MSREMFPDKSRVISFKSFPFPFNFALNLLTSPLKLFLNTSPNKLNIFSVLTSFASTSPSKMLTPFSPMVKFAELLTNGLVPTLQSLTFRTLFFREIFPVTSFK